MAVGSNTLWLEEKLNWIVLCIEPNPELEAHGRKLRRLWRQVACGAQDMEDQVFHAYGDFPHASYSSISCGAIPEGDKLTIKSQVAVRRLDRVLEEAGFSRLDLLCIDVEGYEKEVLAGFTIERWKPQVMVVETWQDNMAVPHHYASLGRREVDNVFVRLGSRAAEMAKIEGVPA